jgi:hypothetical protein
MKPRDYERNVAHHDAERRNRGRERGPWKNEQRYSEGVRYAAQPHPLEGLAGEEKANFDPTQ